MKYWVKQNPLLPYDYSISKLKAGYCKMESNDKLKEIKEIKNCMCYYFDDDILILDLILILIDKKLYENVLVYNIHTKLWLVLNLNVIGSIK